jgi:hypothetical protein
VLGDEPEQAGVQLEVLPDRELRVEREGLAHVTDPPADLHVARVDRLAEQPGGAAAGRQEARQHLHGRGLAAAVRAEKAEDLASVNPEAGTVDRGETAEAHGESVRLDGKVGVVEGESGRWWGAVLLVILGPASAR